MKLTLSALLLCLFAMMAVFGQENTGSVLGTVKDTTGAAIPGAKVSLSGGALVRTIETTTDKEGSYLFPKVPPGTYTVSISQTGFKTIKNEDVNVGLGQAARIDVSLATGSVMESVTISATSETIDVTSSKTATNLNELRIDETPKGRNFNSVLQLAPGVRPEPKAGSAGVGGYQIDGSSGSENAFIIDGVEVSNIRNGSLGRSNAIPFEFVREVQVKSGGFEAEYGGATGGVINVVTKSGSNEFHGEGALLFTNAGLNANGVGSYYGTDSRDFRGYWRLNTTTGTTGEFFRAKEDEYRVFYPGFSVGGPILKDRLNFFSSYFPEVERRERNINFTAAGQRTYTQRVIRHYALERLDYAPTQKIQINTSYMWNPQRVAGLLPSADPSVAPPSNDQSIGGGFTPSSAYTASFNYTPTSRLILSARYGYKYLNDKGNNYGIPNVPRILYTQPTSKQTDPPVPAALAGSTNFANVSSTFATIKDITTRHNIYFDGTYITRLFGQQHTLKGGYAINRISNDVKDDYTNGFFRLAWGTSFTRGSIQNVKGVYGYYVWRDGVRHNAQVSSRNQGFYVQDGWQVTPRLTLNVGARFENEFLPPYTKEVAGTKVANPISFGWGDKIAPRFGAAWDVRGNGTWKISGSYGEFYDVMKYELARGSFGGDYWHDHVYTLDNLNLGNLSKSNPGALSNGKELIDIDNRTVPINAQGQLDGIDPAIKPYKSREFSVTSEHQIGANRVFSARYTHKNLVRTIEDIGYLNAEESEVYIIGNPGFGETDISKKSPSGDPLTPRAKRVYDGLELRFDGRFTTGPLRNLSYFTGYTYSRLYGNYSGLANSDENGRSDPNVSRAFDLTQVNFDSKGKNVYGRLATDRPHTFKFFGSYDVKWLKGNTRFSLSQIAYSGTPLTSEVSYIVPVYFNGRGDLGRTPVLTQTDILVAHTIALSERVKMKFDANVVNLFNQASVTNANTGLSVNGDLPITLDQFFKGFNPSNYIYPFGAKDSSGKLLTPNPSPIYKLPFSYQLGREIRLGVHVSF